VIDIPKISIEFKETYRIIPSLYPPKSVFDEVASQDEIEYLFFIESLTNDRLRNEIGVLSLIDKDEWVIGEGSTPIMAAFTHIGNEGRFNTEEFGVYYASLELETAISETIYRKELFLGYTNEPEGDFDMRVYCARLQGNLYDIRDRNKYSLYYHKTDYRKPQKFAVSVRKERSDGIMYSSVRRENGINLAVFRPKVVTLPCIAIKHITYRWDGKKIIGYYEKGTFEII